MELFKLFGKIAVENDEANKNIDESAKKAEQSESKMTGAFKKIGAAVATYMTFDVIRKFGAEIINATAEVSAEASAFSQIMGDYTDEASKKVEKIADATGMVDSRLTPYMTSMTAKFKGLGYDIDDATDLASGGLNLAADAAAFWDKSLDDSMGALNSFINGSYEGGEAIGLFANDTQMAQYAVQNSIVASTKDWASLDEATKQATRLEYAQAMFELSGATGQAAKESDQYANVQANMTEKWRQFKAEIGEPLLQNVVIPAMDKLSGVVDAASVKFQELKDFISGAKDKFQELKQWVDENKTALEMVAIAVGTLTTAIIAYNVAQAIKNAGGIIELAQLAATAIGVAGLTVAEWAATAATTAWGAATAFLTSPITLVILAIGALIAAVVLCVKHWDQIKETIIKVWESIKNAVLTAVNTIRTSVSNIFNSVKDTVINIFSGIYNVISDKINAAKNIVSIGLNAIREFFDKLKLKFPDFKLPHFNIQGKFSLDPLSVPKFGIDWYAKAMDDGMILNKPTIFGINGSGYPMGAGEAGSETIVGTNSLSNMIHGAVQNEMSGISIYFEKLISIITTYFPEVIANSNKEIVLDSGTLVGQLAPAMDGELGNINRMRVRGC